MPSSLCNNTKGTLQVASDSQKVKSMHHASGEIDLPDCTYICMCHFAMEGTVMPMPPNSKFMCPA